MLVPNFELIPTKNGFFMNFQRYSKIGPKSLYYSAGVCQLMKYAVWLTWHALWETLSYVVLLLVSFE